MEIGKTISSSEIENTISSMRGEMDDRSTIFVHVEKRGGTADY